MTVFPDPNHQSIHRIDRRTDMATHRLEPDANTATDVFCGSHRPVAVVDPGDRVVVRSLDASGHLSPQSFAGEQRPLMFPAKRGHCLVGPIAVRGARPGHVLSVRFDSLRPDIWGFTVAGGRDNMLNRRLGTATVEPSWLLWQLDPDARIGTNQLGHRVDLAPFLGVVGLASNAGEHSTTPPRTLGAGNIDCRDLVAGSTLFIPVILADALLYVGDGHAAQGDGEVGGTAIECGMTSELVLDLLDDAPVASVHAVTPTSRITFGFSADLNEATGDALDAMLIWMQQLLDVDKPTALAVASIAVNLRITQVANETWGVHAVLANDTLTRGLR
jgi:acetamidase/formamidase